MNLLKILAQLDQPGLEQLFHSLLGMKHHNVMERIALISD
jgi:hypothetical protein